MYELLAKLEALIEKWENVPYSGDLTKAAKSICASELRDVIGEPTMMTARKWMQDKTSSDASLQAGYYDDECPF